MSRICCSVPDCRRTWSRAPIGPGGQTRPFICTHHWNTADAAARASHQRALRDARRRGGVSVGYEDNQYQRVVSQVLDRAGGTA